MPTALDIVESIRAKKMVKVRDIADAIERFAPKSLQESYDNSGLQTGNPEEGVSAVMICLDITEQILEEAIRRQCNMVVCHHPLLFHGLKCVSGKTPTERIVIRAIRTGVAIYAAHTNLDSAPEGVSHEMAHMLDMSHIRVLEPKDPSARTGLGVIGEITPTPKLEFLRRVKDIFGVKTLKYSENSPQLVIKRVALCGGSGASLISEAIEAGADAMVTGDVKYHDFTSYAPMITIADIGHYESELCSRQVFARLIRENFPDLPLYLPQSEANPIGTL